MIAAAALVVTSMAAPARAVEVTGTFNPTDPNPAQIATLAFPDTGVYLVGFEVSRPGFLEFLINWTLSYDFFDPETGEPMGGNDVDMNITQLVDPPGLAYSQIFKLDRPYAIFNGIWDETGHYHGGLVLNGAFEGDEPVEYRLYAELLGAVPEPGVWAVLVVGFGLTGAALRRRRSLSLQAA